MLQGHPRRHRPGQLYRVEGQARQRIMLRDEEAEMDPGQPIGGGRRIERLGDRSVQVRFRHVMLLSNSHLALARPAHLLRGAAHGTGSDLVRRGLGRIPGPAPVLHRVPRLDPDHEPSQPGHPLPAIVDGRRLRVGRQHATIRRGAPGAQSAPGGWHGRRRAVDHSPLRARSRGGGRTWGDRRAPRPGRPGPTADHATRFRRARAGGGGARRGGGGPGAGIRHPARTLGRRGALAPRFPGPARQRRAWRDGGDPHLGLGPVRVRQGSDRQRRYLLRRSGVLGPGPRRSPDRLRQLVACGIEARQRPTDAARIVCAAAYPSIVVILDAGRTSARWRAGIEPGEKLGIRVAATSQGRRP